MFVASVSPAPLATLGPIDLLAIAICFAFAWRIMGGTAASWWSGPTLAASTGSTVVFCPAKAAKAS